MGGSAWTIPLSTVPGQMAIHQFILQETDLLSHIENLRHHSSSHLAIPLHFDHQKLARDVLSGLKKFGQYQFQYGKEIGEKKDVYLSSSLTYNPEAYDKTSDNPHQATLGSTVLTFNSEARYNKNSEIQFRNSYHDTYAFNQRTPLSMHESLGIFLDTFQRTIIRSRISSIIAGHDEATKFGFNWHNDESIFINLRVNIPIQTSPNYVIQIMNELNQENFDIEEFDMQIGLAYVYDTHKFHRAFCKQLENFDRIHMICGVSPWFDFDPLELAWKSNEYYGKIHPFDMLREGLISPLIKE